MKDVATGLIEAYIESQKKRKQIFSITLAQDLYDDAMIVAKEKHAGNFSACVSSALEEYIDKEVAKGLVLINKK